MLDYKKLIRIGIDRLVLYNFEVLRSPPMGKTDTQLYLEEYVRVKDELFSLDSTIRLYADGRLTEYKSLSFNPNKILYGHNIYNSRPEDIQLAIECLKKMLFLKGIEIDLTNAKIEELEVNFNFNIDFLEYTEVFTSLFIKQKQFKKTSEGSKSTSYKNIYKDQTISSNLKTSRVQIYDKTKEINNPNLLSEKITRLEWWFHNSVYHYFIKRYSLDNKLNTLLKNFHILEELFLDKTKKELLKKGFEFLNNELKPTLERKYIDFKRTNRFAKSKGSKQKRDVYKYLEKEVWIFDYLYLLEIVEKHDKDHIRREKERIVTKYKHHNGIEKLEYFHSFLFPH